MPIFQKSALVFVSASLWGGWHHVEVHNTWWWRSRFEAQGFIFSQVLTDMCRKEALNDYFAQPNPHSTTLGQHIRLNLLVFINPAVASLPEHSHLFGGHGCYGDVIGNEDGGIACKQTDKLPVEYTPLINCAKNTTSSPDVAYQTWKCKQWNPRNHGEAF